MADMTAPTRIAEYGVRFDHAYYAAAMARLRPFRHAFRFVGHAFLAVAVCLFLFLCAIAIADREWWKVGFAGVPFVGFLVYLRFRAPRGIERLRTVVGYRKSMQVLVTSSGVELVSHPASISLRWSVFSRADIGKRGILLVHDDGTAVWLPEASRTSGSVDDVEQVVTRQIANVDRSR